MSSDLPPADRPPTPSPGADERAFVRAMWERPDDTNRRLVFADWLEERGHPRGELVRLSHALTRSAGGADRATLEDRLRSLVAAGVRPVGPFATNGLGMEFAWIPAGTFPMGSPAEEARRYDDEIRHPVILTEGFYLAVHPVTQPAWRAVADGEPSFFRGDDLPAEGVSWEDCGEFPRRLGGREGRVYPLLIEAEWEYACRAGTTTPFYFGNECNGLQTNCDGNYPCGTGEKGPWLEETCPVVIYPPRAKFILT